MKLNKDVSEKIKTDITKIITEEIEEDLQTINLYLYRDEILSEEKINIGLEKEVIAKDKTGMVFADLAPEYNWAHPCKYFLYSIDTNKVIDKFDAEFPPTDFYSKYDLLEDKKIEDVNKIGARIKKEVLLECKKITESTMYICEDSGVRLHKFTKYTII